MLHRITRSLICCLILLIILPAAQAQATYPLRIDRYIDDYAGVLNSEVREAVRKVLVEFRQTTGADMFVLTINSRTEYSANNQTIQEYATNVYNTWGPGTANQTLLLVAATVDREAWIAGAEGYGGATAAALESVINHEILPWFADYDYGRGIYQGVLGTARVITGLDFSSVAGDIFPPVTDAPVATAKPTMTPGLRLLPERNDVYFNDASGEIPERYATAIRAMLATLEQTKNRKMTVLAVPSVSDYLNTREPYIDRFGPILYDAWDLGGSTPTMLMVYATLLNDVWIQQNNDSTTVDTALLQRVQQVMAPSWQNNDKGRALYDGVKTAIEAITGEAVADTYSSGAENVVGDIVQQFQQNPLPFVIIAVFVLGAIGTVLRQLMRSGSRY